MPDLTRAHDVKGLTADRLAPGRPYTRHVLFADLLGNEIADGLRVGDDGTEVEGRMPVDDHIECFWYCLKPLAADAEAEAEIAGRRVRPCQPDYPGVFIDAIR